MFGGVGKGRARGDVGRNFCFAIRDDGVVAVIDDGAEFGGKCNLCRAEGGRGDCHHPCSQSTDGGANVQFRIVFEGGVDADRAGADLVRVSGVVRSTTESVGPALGRVFGTGTAVLVKAHANRVSILESSLIPLP